MSLKTVVRFIQYKMKNSCWLIFFWIYNEERRISVEQWTCSRPDTRTQFLFVLPGQVVMLSCAHLYLARLLNTFKTAQWTSSKGCFETSIRIWSGLDAMALKSDLVSTDRSSEGMSAEWKINVKASSDRPFTSASEELILLHRIFMISSLRALLSNTTLRPCSECATAPIVCIAINLRAGSVAVRKEKTVCRKMGYCWVTSAGLDCAR